MTPGGRRATLLCVIAAVLAVPLLAACGGDEAPQPRPTATMGFTQLIPREGTRHGLLRVTSTSEGTLAVESVALAWPGYAGGAPSPSEATLAPGATLDLRLELPDPTCDADPGQAPAGVVETDAGEVRAELTASGATYLRRLWDAQCERQVVDDAVAISYSPRWRVVGEGADSRARGELVLRRREGADQPSVRVTGVDGSVLYGLRLVGPTELAPGDSLARVGLEITPGNRCDEHARGQATAPFDFVMDLRVGERGGLAHPVSVPLAAMTAAEQALDRACAARQG